MQGHVAPERLVKKTYSWELGKGISYLPSAHMSYKYVRKAIYLQMAMSWKRLHELVSHVDMPTQKDWNAAAPNCLLSESQIQSYCSPFWKQTGATTATWFDLRLSSWMMTVIEVVLIVPGFIYAR